MGDLTFGVGYPPPPPSPLLYETLNANRYPHLQDSIDKSRVWGTMPIYIPTRTRLDKQDAGVCVEGGGGGGGGGKGSCTVCVDLKLSC